MISRESVQLSRNEAAYTPSALSRPGLSADYRSAGAELPLDTRSATQG